MSLCCCVLTLCSAPQTPRRLSYSVGFPVCQVVPLSCLVMVLLMLVVFPSALLATVASSCGCTSRGTGCGNGAVLRCPNCPPCPTAVLTDLEEDFSGPSSKGVRDIAIPPSAACGDPLLLLPPGAKARIRTSLDQSRLTYALINEPFKAPAVVDIDGVGNLVASSARGQSLVVIHDSRQEQSLGTIVEMEVVASNHNRRLPVGWRGARRGARACPS